jgi:hypothetical protein
METHDRQASNAGGPTDLNGIDKHEEQYGVHLNAACVRSAHYELQIALILASYARRTRTPTLDSVCTHRATRCAEGGEVVAAALATAMLALFERGPSWMRVPIRPEEAQTIIRQIQEAAGA